MPVPVEYSRASDIFYEFLVEVRDAADLWSTHVTYTMVEGVLHTFRRRLTPQQTISFAELLPVCLRSVLIERWDLSEPTSAFGNSASMIDEVRALRSRHNFSPDNAIAVVSNAILKYVDQERFFAFLAELPPGAVEFWTGRAHG
ncbi:DUF2267 domain-containing protein [Herbaspirillum sp. DW155]|uniref:DUF2267 domain-containing protein n=1 Tax=Herbaspirillum sp. DW155 TaxID=3095609 RepID=UPI003090D96D|nr:DUF2267 domain-containing protein [Herbaspirillum sp. DW155]